MEPKRVIPIIDLDSIEFHQKILYSLSEADGVGTTLPSMGGRTKELHHLTFLLMNTKSSQRKLCTVCGSHHWFFVKEFEPTNLKDKKMLCTNCGSILGIMILLKTPQNIIKEWMNGKGEVDPFNTIRDSIDKMIKSGEIKHKFTEDINEIIKFDEELDKEENKENKEE